MKLLQKINSAASKIKVLAFAAAASLLIGQNCPAYAQIAAPNDPLVLSGQQFNAAFYHLGFAWSRCSGRGIKVAIIANGVDANYADLVGKVVGVGGLGTPTNHMQYPDGTIMANLIAGRANNNIDGCGIAPDAQILDIKIVDGSLPNRYSSAQADKIVQGIQQAQDAGARIIVLPFTTFIQGQFENPADYPRVRDALAGFHSRNGLVFMPAGDDNLRDNNTPMYEQIIVISGFNRALQLERSNTGNAVKLSASQVGLGLSWERPLTQPVRNPDHISATRFAAAEAAGCAALLWSYNLSLPNTEIEHILRSTASNNAAYNPNYGYGFPNLEAALQMTPSPPPYQPFVKKIKRIDIDLPPLHVVPRTTPPLQF